MIINCIIDKGIEANEAVYYWYIEVTSQIRSSKCGASFTTLLMLNNSQLDMGLYGSKP